MSKIFTIGETTYDIIFKNDKPESGVIGGSALNTSVTLGRLKYPVHFISRIGNDHIGDLSYRFLIENGVNCDNIIRYEGNSRLAMAFMDAQNNAEYQFYNTETTPSLLFPELHSTDIITFGSSNAISNDGREYFLDFLKKARAKRLITIYDPNIRKSNNEIKEKVEENFAYSMVIKASVQDFLKLYGISDAEKIFTRLSKYGVRALVLTDGDKPVTVCTSEFSEIYIVEPINVLNTIGAGDNFTAGLIAGFMRYSITADNILELKEDIWDNIIHICKCLSAEVCLSEKNYISEEFARTFFI